MNIQFCQAFRSDFISSDTAKMWNPFFLLPVTFGFILLRQSTSLLHLRFLTAIKELI